MCNGHDKLLAIFKTLVIIMKYLISVIVFVTLNGSVRSQNVRVEGKTNSMFKKSILDKIGDQFNQILCISMISIIISGAKNGQNGEEICQVQGISEKDCMAIGCCRWNDTGYSLSDQHIFSTIKPKIL